MNGKIVLRDIRVKTLGSSYGVIIPMGFVKHGGLEENKRYKITFEEETDIRETKKVEGVGEL